MCKLSFSGLSSILLNVVLSDRCRTTTNMLGDAYGAAVVAALSSKELRAMDAGKDQVEEDTSDTDTADVISDIAIE